MQTLRMMLLTLAAGAIQAQDITEVTIQPDFVSTWLDTATAIEIAIPPGAHTYAVQFGPDELQPAMSTFLHRPPTLQAPGISTEPDRLRLVIVPPEQPGGNGICNRHNGQATLFIGTVTSDGHTDYLHNLPFCVPYPAHSEPSPTNRFAMAIIEQPVVIGEWTPVYLHAWLYDPTETSEFLPIDQAFSIHISFHADNRSTHIPNELPPRIPELLDLDEVRYTLRER